MTEQSQEQPQNFAPAPIEEANTGIKGVEAKVIFEEAKQQELLAQVNQWFQEKKDSFPKAGLSLLVPRYASDGAQAPSLSRANGTVFSRLEGAADVNSDIEIPESLIELFNAVIDDSARDPDLSRADTLFVLERTGVRNTHPEDNEFHVDTKQIYWDENGERIGYDPKRSKPAYMIFVGRPGTLVVHQTLDSSLSQQQANSLTRDYMLNTIDGTVVANNGVPMPKVSQLMPNSIYKVAVGDIPHSPPLHDDGLLITVRFNTDD